MGSMTFSPPELGHEDAVISPGPYTVADLDEMPDDGYRHELIDGMLVMSPPARMPHQDVALSLAVLLKADAPRELKVTMAPSAVRRLPDMYIEPDVVVFRRADITGELAVIERPVLAVEVASPSTRTFDLGRKKEFLAELGCPSYWTIEPQRGPELTVWTLRDGNYEEEAVVTGAESWTASAPFPVTVVPADLLDE